MTLGRKTVSGALWSIAGSLGGRFVGLIGTLLITHFLAPEVVGEVGVASVLVLTFSQLSSFGFGQYLTAKPHAGSEMAFHAAVYHVTFGVLALGLLLLVMKPLGPVYDAPDMYLFVPGLGLAMLMDRIAYVPERVLMRDLHFRAVALTRSASEVVYASVSVAGAVAGWGGQAIVVGNIAQSGLRLLLYLYAAPRDEWLVPCRLSRERTRELFRFGLPAAVAGLIHFVSRKWDNLLFSSFFGPGTMAHYNMAYNLADLPASNVAEQVSDVLAPSFGRMPEEDRRRAVVRSAGLLGLVVFPLAIGLAAVSPSLVAALFNEQWQGIAPLLIILAALSVARPVTYVIAPFLFAEDRPRTVMWIELGKTVLLLAMVAGLARFGVLLAAAGVGVAFASASVASIWIVHRHHGVPAAPFAMALLRPLAACAPMAAAAYGVHLGMVELGVSVTRPAVELGVAVLAGALVYIPSAFLLAPAQVRDVLDQLRKRRRGGSGGGSLA